VKILVVSDSHGEKSSMLRALEVESPDMIIHLGDYIKDCNIIYTNYPDLSIRSVRGNGDYFSAGNDTEEFIVYGKRFFITHGHLFDVKSTMNSIIKAGEHRGVDFVLFGHTHKPYHVKSGSITYINPGAIGSREKTYAVLECKNGEIFCQLKSV